MYTTTENDIPNIEHLLAINQRFISKVLMAGIIAYLVVWACL
jgi:hypothetical protein